MNDVHARATRRAVSAMIEKAQELGVNGVAVAGLNTADPIFMSIEARCTNDLLVLDGQNLLAIALSKLAQCVRTGLESGQEAVGGENHWQGGVIDPELLSKARTQLVCAFSGGTEEQDTHIANAGLGVGRITLQANIMACILERLLFD